MKLPHIVLAGLIAGVSATAQFTSPAGFDLIEGNSSQTQLFGPVDRRFQQIDATAIAMGASSLSSIAFRRDGDRAAPSATARTFDIEVVLAHADPTAAISPVFANNYAGGTSTTVVATRQVSLPDWTPMVAGPAPFDLQIAFDAPFAYDPINGALAWEITVTNNSSLATVYTDRHIGSSAFAAEEAVQTATGCTVTGQAQPFESWMTIFNWGTNHPTLGQRLTLFATNATPNSSVVMNLTLDTPPTPIPILCAPLSLDIVTFIMLGTSSPTGFSPDRTVDIPYNPVLNNLNLGCQSMVLDPGQAAAIPVAVSDVKVAQILPPLMPLECGYVYAGPGDSVGQVFLNRGVIVEFQ